MQWLVNRGALSCGAKKLYGKPEEKLRTEGKPNV